MIIIFENLFLKHVVMDIENARSWVRQFKEDQKSSENKPKKPRQYSSRSDDMIARMLKI